MAPRETTRQDDLRDLEILDLADREGGAAAQRRFRITNSVLQGLRQRTAFTALRMGCRCTKPENQDGGMPARWWAA